MTRIWRDIWHGSTQRSNTDRILDRIALVVLGGVLIWYAVQFVKLGPIDFVMMCLEAFSALVPG